MKCKTFIAAALVVFFHLVPVAMVMAEDRSDAIENHLDLRGDRINSRLDAKGDRIDNEGDELEKIADARSPDPEQRQRKLERRER